MLRLLIFGLFVFIHSFTSAQGNSMEIQAQNLAREVITAAGGSENFNNIHYIGWNFFGSRQIIWDKVNERVRIDYLKKKVTIICDLKGEHGRVFLNGTETIDPDSLKKYLAKGSLIWMNDSYWLAMPFKLLDPGVHLNLIGMSYTLDSTLANVIEMTFSDVGATPENKYLIYIDPATHFIVQWDFYNAYTDPLPEFTNIWGDYKKYGSIYLSGDRGTEGVLTDIHVWDSLPEYIFTDMKIPPLSEF